MLLAGLQGSAWVIALLANMTFDTFLTNASLLSVRASSGGKACLLVALLLVGRDLPAANEEDCPHGKQRGHGARAAAQRFAQRALPPAQRTLGLLGDPNHTPRRAIQA